MAQGTGRGLWSKLVMLSKDEQSYLARQPRRLKVPQRMAKRRLVILLCADGWSDSEATGEASVCLRCVGTWRRRFQKCQLDGLFDRSRSATPPVCDLGKVKEVVNMTFREKSATATHWSRRSMTREIGVLQATVGRIWKAHRTQYFSLSTDDEFPEKITDMVGLYFTPLINATVLTIDENPRIRAFSRSQ